MSNRGYFLVSDGFKFGVDWMDRPHGHVFMIDRTMTKPLKRHIMYVNNYYMNGIDISWNYYDGGAIRLEVKRSYA